MGPYKIGADDNRAEGGFQLQATNDSRYGPIAQSVRAVDS